MNKLTVYLFILSFLLLALALCVVPSWVNNDSKYIIQLSLFIAACIIDIIALRHQQKRSMDQ